MASVNYIQGSAVSAYVEEPKTDMHVSRWTFRNSNGEEKEYFVYMIKVKAKTTLEPSAKKLSEKSGARGIGRKVSFIRVEPTQKYETWANGFHDLLSIKGDEKVGTIDELDKPLFSDMKQNIFQSARAWRVGHKNLKALADWLAAYFEAQEATQDTSAPTTRERRRSDASVIDLRPRTLGTDENFDSDLSGDEKDKDVEGTSIPPTPTPSKPESDTPEITSDGEIASEAPTINHEKETIENPKGSFCNATTIVLLFSIAMAMISGIVKAKYDE